MIPDEINEGDCVGSETYEAIIPQDRAIGALESSAKPLESIPSVFPETTNQGDGND